MLECVAAPELVTPDLHPIVSSLFEDETARVLGWSVERLAYRVWCRASGGVFRVSGDAQTAQGRKHWSAILKVLCYLPWNPTLDDLREQCDDGGDEPADFGYWLREAKAYNSGLLSAGGALRAPRCFGIRMVGDDRCWLWLEDVDGIPAQRWKRHRFLEAAQHLGEFQGAFLTGHCKLPTHEWFYRSFVESSAPGYRAQLLSRFDDGALWADPLTQRTIDRSVLKMAKRVWQHHEVLVQSVRRLPKTVCHWDVASENLLAADQLTPTTVLLDWGTVGLGPAGADLSILVGTSLCNEIGPRDLDELESELLSAYLMGLREAGWDGHEGEVTFAYRVFAALHFGILVGLLMRKLLNLDWRKRKAQERGQPIERIVGDQVAFMARTLEGVLPYLQN